MAILLSKPISVATAVGTAPVLIKKLLTSELSRLTLEAVFAPGNADGSTVDAWVVSSIDQGLSWFDIAQFHFTTVAAKRIFNLCAFTPVTTQYTPTLGTLTANTVKDGVLGSQFGVIWSSTGTYTGGASLNVYTAGARLTN